MITELLSPAGSYESFEAAIGAGADAVYVGGPAFGARAYAQNFTQEELITAIETAHIHNRKLYLLLVISSITFLCIAGLTTHNFFYYN